MCVCVCVCVWMYVCVLVWVCVCVCVDVCAAPEHLWMQMEELQSNGHFQCKPQNRHLVLFKTQKFRKTHTIKSPQTGPREERQEITVKCVLTVRVPTHSLVHNAARTTAAVLLIVQHHIISQSSVSSLVSRSPHHTQDMYRHCHQLGHYVKKYCCHTLQQLCSWLSNTIHYNLLAWCALSWLPVPPYHTQDMYRCCHQLGYRVNKCYCHTLQQLWLWLSNTIISQSGVSLLVSQSPYHTQDMYRHCHQLGYCVNKYYCRTLQKLWFGLIIQHYTL